MNFSGFIGKLKNHEMKMKVREEKKTPKKKAITFNATPSSFDEEESSKNSDEDFSMLIRKVGKMFYKKGRQSNFRRGRHQGRLKRRRWVFTFIAKDGTSNCGLPLTTSTTSKNVHKKKKAMMATWDDSETESEEEN